MIIHARKKRKKTTIIVFETRANGIMPMIMESKLFEFRMSVEWCINFVQRRRTIKNIGVALQRLPLCIIITFDEIRYIMIY